MSHPAAAAALAALQTRIGQEVQVSDWLPIMQERVDAFAEATGDHQWIHVDAARARRESPFGGPIAHGYLTLSLLVCAIISLSVCRGGRGNVFVLVKDDE